MIKLGLMELMGVLEIIIILLVVAVVMTVRGIGLSRRVRELMARVPETMEVQNDAISYESYLRDEILKTNGLVDRYQANGDVPDWLNARHQFLKLELDAQDLADNPHAFENRLSEGFLALVDQYRPEPEIVTEPAPIVEVTPEPEPEPEAKNSEKVPEDELHKKEMVRLRDLIGHQQDAMKTLRTELESREGEIADLESIVAQLDAFEAQTAELVRCIEVLEHENDRLKHATEDGDTTGAGPSPEELSRLKEMVNDQQSTIGNLQGMIEQLRPEAGKAHELEDMVNDVLKSNQELNTCILVLEEENQSLRNQLDALEESDTGQPDEVPAMGGDVAPFQQKIQELESLLEFKDATLEQMGKDLEKLRQGGGDAAASGERIGELEALVEELETRLANTEVGATDEELEIKVQELEALLEFKEATIEEMEKQYAEVEAKYLELAGGEIPET